MLVSYEVQHYLREFSAQVHKIVDVLETKVLPAFENLDAEVDAEVEQAIKAGYSNENSWIPADQRYDAAVEYGTELYDQGMSARQALLNLHVVAIYHLFEQRMRVLHRRATGKKPPDHEAGVRSHWDAKSGFKILGEEDVVLMDEVRLLANVVKHGDGKSADALHQLNNRLLISEAERSMLGSDMPDQPHKAPIDSPLWGEGVYVKMNDIARYREGLVRVFEAYLNAMSTAIH